MKSSRLRLRLLSLSLVAMTCLSTGCAPWSIAKSAVASAFAISVVSEDESWWDANDQYFEWIFWPFS